MFTATAGGCVIENWGSNWGSDWSGKKGVCTSRQFRQIVSIEKEFLLSIYYIILRFYFLIIFYSISNII